MKIRNWFFIAFNFYTLSIETITWTHYRGKKMDEENIDIFAGNVCVTWLVWRTIFMRIFSSGLLSNTHFIWQTTTPSEKKNSLKNSSCSAWAPFWLFKSYEKYFSATLFTNNTQKWSTFNNGLASQTFNNETELANCYKTFSQRNIARNLLCWLFSQWKSFMAAGCMYSTLYDTHTHMHMVYLLWYFSEWPIKCWIFNENK